MSDGCDLPHVGTEEVLYAGLGGFFPAILGKPVLGLALAVGAVIVMALLYDLIHKLDERVRMWGYPDGLHDEWFRRDLKNGEVGP